MHVKYQSQVERVVETLKQDLPTLFKRHLLRHLYAEYLLSRPGQQI
jgi:hypothetical protein